VLGPYLRACSKTWSPTEEEAHSTDLRECVDECGSERADAECQSCSWEEPAWTHSLAQDVQGNLENDVRDIEHTEDCVIVCRPVSVALRIRWANLRAYRSL
jgi:hypothetical protein